MNLTSLATRLSQVWLALLIAGAFSLATPLRADCVVVFGDGSAYLVRCGFGTCYLSQGSARVRISPTMASDLCGG